MTNSIETVARYPRNQVRPFRRRLAGLLALATTCAVLAPGLAPAQDLNPDTLLAHVKYLASDRLAGRETGEPGADTAAAYIARAFGRYGLEPLGGDGYLQRYQVPTTISIDESSRLVLSSARGSRTLKLYDEWLPFSFSSAGSLTGSGVPVGYGLGTDAYGDFAGRNGTRIAIVLGGTPDDYNPHQSGADTSPRRKATTAREQGAAAVLITVPRISVPQPGDPPHAVGIPAIQILDSADIKAWLGDDDLTVMIDAKVEPLLVQAYNVVGRLTGNDPDLADEVIVVGAHYDHLGMGGPGSLAPDVVAVHNGADDNASGTAAVLGIARYFAAHPEARPARSLVLVAFSGEEMGLLGSEYFVSHPPVPLPKVTAMVNFDEVGRLRDGKLQVFGTATADEFPAVLDSLGTVYDDLRLSYVGDGYGPSDQTSFYARDIPVLHLFTGTHSQYHRPEDDWQLINARGLAEVTDFAIDLIQTLGNWPGELHLEKQERPQATGGGRGYGPWLGTIPDFSEVEGGGLRLSGVREGSPAATAGLQAGDVVIEFGGKKVLNIYDYTYALREHAPGDTVLIKVKRHGDVVDVTAVLGKRN